MLSRVVPATGLAITRSSFAKALTNVLFPTLRRPTIATFISGRSVVAGSSPSTVSGRSFVIASTNSSRLRFCFVLVTSGEPNPSASKSWPRTSNFSSSDLLATKRTFAPDCRRRRATSPSAGTQPVRMSTTKTTTPAVARPASICMSICSVNPSGSSKPIPPVSMRSIIFPPHSIL